MVTWIVLLSIAALGAGYFTYGRFVAKTLDLDDSRQTPACRINGGKDYGPARGPASQVLLKRWNVKPRLGAHRKFDSLGRLSMTLPPSDIAGKSFGESVLDIASHLGQEGIRPAHFGTLRF